MIRFAVKLIIVFLLCVFLIGALFYFWLQKDKTLLPKFIRENLYIKLPPKVKELIKEKLRPLYNWIYQEVTKHNPPGDFFPDSFDDRLKNEIKERVN